MNDSKKIGIDARLWNESGVGRYIRNLVNGIDKKKLKDNYVVFLNSKSYLSIDFKNPNIKKVKSSARWHSLSEQWIFKKEIENENLDLMHFPYFSYPALYKKPFVITIHDLIIDHFPTGIASSLPAPIYKMKHFGYRKLVQLAVKNSQKIITPSRATKDEIISHYNPDADKIEVIYEGFDPLISDGQKSGNLVSNNYILYVGNAYPHKNLNRLFEAYLKIKKVKDIDLICIGRNDFFYKKFEEKKMDGVHILHDIDDSTLFEYYTNASLYVMPSLMEGFGLPTLEAMSLSCPVISSDTNALKEICGDAALYFDAKSSTDLANVAIKVLEDRKLSSDLIEKGRIQAKRYSWDKCVDETLRIYESCNSV